MANDTEAVCDYYLKKFRALEQQFLRDGTCAHTVSVDLSEHLVDLCEHLARRLLELASASCAQEVAATVRSHPLHREVILQSPTLRHALEKPRGYAGDMDLMLRICHPPMDGPDGFAGHLDAFFRGLPASQAVRDRVCMLGRAIDELPAGSRVLNLASGPALEVQDHYRRRPESTLTADLVDHDVDTLAYLRGRVPPDRVRLLQGNALRLLAGDLRVRPAETSSPNMDFQRGSAEALEPGYDLIYSAGLYDYIPDGRGDRGGVIALTAVLASLLKPGGILLVGNYLRPRPGSRHQPHHRAMMELYSDWHLRYRDAAEIRHFASSVARPHTLDLLDEHGRSLRSVEESVIGFVAIRAH